MENKPAEYTCITCGEKVHMTEHGSVSKCKCDKQVNIWAKIFVVDNLQVLFYSEYDSVEEVSVIHQMFHTEDGLQIDMKLESTDENFIEENFEKYATEEQAKKVVNLVNKKLLGE